MTLGDNIVRFSPDGSFFTTNGFLGLENSVRQVYGTAESHSCGVWARPSSLPTSGQDADVFRIADDRPLGRFASFFFHRNELRIGLLENGAGIVNWTYTITATSGSPPDTMILVGTTPVEVGKWYHILGCKNDTFTARLFVNGVSETLELVGVPPSNNNVKRSGIGFDFSPATDWIAPDHHHGNFNGDIHSVALWNIAISEEAVRSVYNGGWKDLDLNDDRNPAYNDAVNLVHWWRIGQGITDAHTAGNEFIVDWVDSGGISITEEEGTLEQSDILKVGESPSGTSVDFDGASAMSTPTAVPIGVVNEWTVSAWIKPRNVLTTDSDIMYIGPDSSEIDSILISQNGDTANDPLVVTVRDTAGTTIFAHEYNNVLTEDEWQHVGVTWDGATLNTYLDGSLLIPDVVGVGAGVAQADSSRDILLGTGPLSDPVPFDREYSVDVTTFTDAMLSIGLRFTEWGGSNWSIAGWFKPTSTTPFAGSDLGIFDAPSQSSLPVSIVSNDNRVTIKFVTDGGGLWTLQAQVWDATGSPNILWEFTLGTTDIADILTNGMNEWNFFCMTYDDSLSGVANIITMYMNGVEITATSTTGTSVTHTQDQVAGQFRNIQYGNTGNISGGTGFATTNVMPGRYHRLGIWGNLTLSNAEQVVLYNANNPPEIDWFVNQGSYTSGQNDLTYYHQLGNHVHSDFAMGPFDWSELWNWGNDGTTFLPEPFIGGDDTTAWFHISQYDLDGLSSTGVPDFIDGDPADSRTPVGGVTNPWNGRMGHVGIWREVLSADDIRTVYSKGQQLDLRYNVDGYSGAESLENYFKPGEDTTLLGRNFIDMNRPAAARVLTLITGDPLSAGDSPTSPFVAPVTGEGRSVSLDGVSEYFANTSLQLLGIANTWSISLWANRQQLLADRQIIKIGSTDSGLPNTILLAASGSADLRLILQDDVGAVFIEFVWEGVFTSLDSWEHIAFTFDGVSIVMYLNGTATFPDFFIINGSGTMDDNARSIFYGAFKVGQENPFPGFLGHLGIWNTVLSAGDVTEIFDNGHSIDLRSDFGSYVSSLSLKHYWRPGFEDVGFTDLQANPTSIDFDNSVNLDVTDIVDDAP